ncbi:MAG TPA: DUF427 domain-containing protein [Actinomycetota bacterium]|nr:DUF427 domain-containing protein [Actinomycetota bacterium]
MADQRGHVLEVEPCDKRVRVSFNGEVIADTTDAKVLRETGLPPVYYVPFADIRREVLTRTDHSTHCPFKGQASYWTVTVGDRAAENALWAYEDPIPESRYLVDHAAFYTNKVELEIDP